MFCENYIEKIISRDIEPSMFTQTTITSKPRIDFNLVAAHHGEGDRALLVVCSSVSEMRDGMDPARLSAEVKAKLPFFQAGCLLEIYHAARLDKAIVMKCGRQLPKRRAGSSFDSPNSHTFEINSPVLTYNFVDIRTAEVTEDDMNRLLRVAIAAAYATSEHPLLQSAACGLPYRQCEAKRSSSCPSPQRALNRRVITGAWRSGEPAERAGANSTSWRRPELTVRL
eukprot:gene33206-42940_t